jgi:fructoselysine 6-kinase
MDDNGNNRRWGLCEKGVSMFRLDSADLDYLADFDLVHTGETSRLNNQLPEIRERVAISFDFSERELDYAAGVLPYIRAAAFSRGSAGDDEVARVLDAAQSAGVELVTITQGARGATVYHKGEIRFAPAVPVYAVDTLGAGDAFVGRLACRVLAGISLAEAATDAAQYSALICGTRGAFGHARPITREIPS